MPGILVAQIRDNSTSSPMLGNKRGEKTENRLIWVFSKNSNSYILKRLSLMKENLLCLTSSIHVLFLSIYNSFLLKTSISERYAESLSLKFNILHIFFSIQHFYNFSPITEKEELKEKAWKRTLKNLKALANGRWRTEKRKVL